MVVVFKCEGVERGNQYNLFTTEYKMNIDKADALALMSTLQEALNKDDRGEEEDG